MQFRTEIQIPRSNIDIDHKSKILTIGSCFAEVIGSRLVSSKFDCLANPFGTTFNPYSIARLLEHSIDKLPLQEDTYVQTREGWFNLMLHSAFSAQERDQLERSVMHKLLEVHERLVIADLLIITLGTAFVYQALPLPGIVANCHKLPAGQFKKTLLTPQEVVEDLEQVIMKIRRLNPDMKIMLTVSPVRHIKDTLQKNNVSKGILLFATHLLCEKMANIDYFPAYEAMLDDLRDYRFYKEDMIHPTAQAEQYIWELFSHTFCSEATRKLTEQWDDLKKALSHKPFRPDSPAHRQFLIQTLHKLRGISEKLDLVEELQDLEQRLAKQPS